jgi:phage terminase large subunit
VKKIAKKKFNIKDLKIDKQLFNSIYLPYLFDYSHRYNLYFGGRSSGKSFFIVDKLILLGISEKRRMLFLIKQTNRVNETIWRMTLDALEKFQLYEYCDFNKSEHTIIFPNGTYIKMSGMDSENKARGFVDIDTVFFEECTDFLEEDIESVDGTLRGKVKNKQLYFAMNPVSMQNWVYKYFGFDTGIIPPDTFILKTTYLDNKWCDDATIKRMERLKERNPARYKIEAEGNFATLDKLVFSYTAKKLDVNELIRNNTELITLIGMDFGFLDPTTCILSLYDDKSKTLYICDEIYQKGLTNEDIARLVKQKGWHKNVIIADSANPKDIADLRKMGLTKIKPCKKGKNSIISGIKKMQEMEIIINETCENTITEFDNYAWQKSKLTGEYVEIPIDSFNHCIDGIRYSIQNIRKKARILTVKL